MKSYTYQPQGTCSKLIQFDIDEQQCLHNVRFTGGCNGNLKGIASLVEGQPVQTVVERLENIRCGAKPTSCPHQLTQALREAQSMD